MPSSYFPNAVPFIYPGYNAIKINNVPTMKSIFTNNSAVYYKKGSLPAGGVGTVRNHYAKAHKT